MSWPRDYTFLERFWKKVNKGGPVPAHAPELGPCWIWLAYKDEFGRGQFWTGRKLVHAHVIAWELCGDPIPHEMCLLHRCDNMGCLNPGHLRLGTQIENMAEMNLRGRANPRGIFGHRLRKTIRDHAATLEERFWAKVNKNGAIPEHHPELGNCWVWAGSTNRDGYGLFGIGGSGNIMVAHKVHWTLIAKRELPGGMKLLHKCDDPPCVRLDHLFVGTHADNVRDMMNKKRMNFPSGEQHYKTQMTFEEASQIRSLWNAGAQQKELSKRFGITVNMVGKIVNYKRWLRPRGRL